jgi:homotetrameric cytidine deaminase
LNEDGERLADMSDTDFAFAIFRKDIEMMLECDIIIANLTPFRGASADSGTLVELGWFLGRGQPIFGYSNSATLFAQRSTAHIATLPDALPGIIVEGFGLPDNLMVPGAVLQGGGHPMVLPDDGKDRAFDALDVFEACVAIAARSVAGADALVAAALRVRAHAHAPYSNFRVGAAIRAADGSIHIGCNVENAAYPEGLCAEAGVIAAMVAAGQHRIAEIVIAGGGAVPCTPCGGCRQKLREFAAPDMRIRVVGEDGAVQLESSLSTLLPDSFGPEVLGRTNGE